MVDTKDAKNISDYVMRHATFQDVEAMAHVLDDAFRGSPSARYCCPPSDGHTEEHRTKTHLETQTRRSHSYFQSAQDGKMEILLIEEISTQRTSNNNGVVAMAVWEYPRGPFSEREQLPARTDPSVHAYPCNIPHYLAFLGAQVRHKQLDFNTPYGTDGHLYLECLVTRPHAQRKGYGKMLVQYGIDKAKRLSQLTPTIQESKDDERHVEVVVDGKREGTEDDRKKWKNVKAITLDSTPDGKRLYEGLGFKVVSEEFVQAENEKGTETGLQMQWLVLKF